MTDEKPAEKNPEEKIRVYLIRLGATTKGASFVVEDTENLGEALESAGILDASIGESYTVMIAEMTRAEIEALPEFDGF